MGLMKIITSVTPRVQLDQDHDDHHTGLHPGEDQGVWGRLGELEGGAHQHPWKYQVVHSGQQHFIMMIYVREDEDVLF